MGSLGPLNSSLFQYRKRKQLSLDGTVGGIQPNRLRAGVSGAIPGRAIVRSGGAALRDYMSFHHDGYEPHPGEMSSPDAFYSPYQTALGHHPPDELGEPEAGLPHFLSQVAPDAIPNDISLDGSIVPVIDQPAGSPGVDPVINEIWDRVLGHPTYDASRMTDATFLQAMQAAAHSPSAIRPVSAESDMIHNGWFPTPGDQIAAQDDGVSPDEMGGAFRDIDSLGMASDLIFEPEDPTVFDSDAVPDPEFPEAGSFDNGFGMPDGGLLEQIVDELAPPDPGQQPPAEEQMYEDPWMMPGMGPMPPGLGPMGPMM